MIRALFCFLIYSVIKHFKKSLINVFLQFQGIKLTLLYFRALDWKCDPIRGTKLKFTLFQNLTNSSSLQSSSISPTSPSLTLPHQSISNHYAISPVPPQRRHFRLQVPLFFLFYPLSLHLLSIASAAASVMACIFLFFFDNRSSLSPPIRISDSWLN